MVNLSRPDRQLCNRIFWKFRWKSFLFKSRVRTVRHWGPNGRTSAASNFHIKLSVSGPRGWTSGRQFFNTQFPYLLCMRPDEERQTSGRWHLNCDSCLIYDRVRTGNHIVWTVCQSSHILILERIWRWLITDGHLDGLLRGPDGCKLEQKLLDIV
jgi:hypothetical protein